MGFEIQHLPNGDFNVVADKYKMCGCCNNRCDRGDYQCSGCGAILDKSIKARKNADQIDQTTAVKMGRWLFRPHLDG